MERPKGPSAFALHLFAMACMLADHTALVFAPASAALLCVGRLAFPIFAFFVAEGSARTRSRGNYALRLGAAALAAEVPFDLMVYGRLFAPGGQNVLFTFLLALAALEIWQRVPAGVSGRLSAAAPRAAGSLGHAGPGAVVPLGVAAPPKPGAGGAAAALGLPGPAGPPRPGGAPGVLRLLSPAYAGAVGGKPCLASSLKFNNLFMKNTYNREHKC